MSSEGRLEFRFKARLLRPAEPPRGTPWTFLILPKNASAKLPTRGMTTVEGRINGHPFQATLQPDGQGAHWLKVDRKLRAAAGAEAGDDVSLEIAPAAEEPEPRVRRICGRRSAPRTPRRGRYGRTSLPSRAEIGSSGSNPPSGKRRA